MNKTDNGLKEASRECLDRIDSVEALKKMDLGKMEALASNVREAALNRVGNNVGHRGANLVARLIFKSYSDDRACGSQYRD